METENSKSGITTLEAINRLIFSRVLVSFLKAVFVLYEKDEDIIVEGETYNYNFNALTVIITWDWITVVNCNNNKVVCSTSSKNEVLDFLEEI